MQEWWHQLREEIHLAQCLLLQQRPEVGAWWEARARYVRSDACCSSQFRKSRSWTRCLFTAVFGWSLNFPGLPISLYKLLPQHAVGCQELCRCSACCAKDHVPLLCSVCAHAPLHCCMSREGKASVPGNSPHATPDGIDYHSHSRLPLNLKNVCVLGVYFLLLWGFFGFLFKGSCFIAVALLWTFLCSNVSFLSKRTELHPYMRSGPTLGLCSGI